MLKLHENHVKINVQDGFYLGLNFKNSDQKVPKKLIFAKIPFFALSSQKKKNKIEAYNDRYHQ